MSSNSKSNTTYPVNPTHGDMHNGKVFAKPQEAWLEPDEFDAMYPPRSRFMYRGDWE